MSNEARKLAGILAISGALAAGAARADGCTVCEGEWCVDDGMAGYHDCWTDGNSCQTKGACGENNPDPFGPRPPIVALSIYAFGTESALAGLPVSIMGADSMGIRAALATHSGVDPARIHLRAGFQTFGDITGSSEDAVGAGPTGVAYSTARLSSGRVRIQVCTFSEASPSPTLLAEAELADGESLVSQVSLSGQPSVLAFRLTLLPFGSTLRSLMIDSQDAFRADVTTHRETPAYYFVRTSAVGGCMMP